jgi:purine-nucleoside phosphorylase
MTQGLEERILSAYGFIRDKTNVIPTVGLVLGSGLGDFCESLKKIDMVSFAEIPDFPVSTVKGHKGRFVFAKYKDVDIVALQGRLHYYEGYSQQEVTMPIRIMQLLGVKTVILTNAAGGINTSFSPGDVMQIVDHINFSGANPLIGKNLDRFGPRFPDMGDVYTKRLREKLKLCAEAEGISLRQGVYAMYSGPSFETPAEIRFFRTMGADAVGMSTVPEAIVVHHGGLGVIGLSCITNMAAGILDQKLTHEEVIKVSNQVKGKLAKVLSLAIEVAKE